MIKSREDFTLIERLGRRGVVRRSERPDKSTLIEPRDRGINSRFTLIFNRTGTHNAAADNLVMWGRKIGDPGG